MSAQVLFGSCPEVLVNDCFVNGFLDDVTNELVLLHRFQGSLMARRRRADWTCFLLASEVTPEVMKQLRTANSVAGVVTEGDYVRVRFVSSEARAYAVQPHSARGCTAPGCGHRGFFDELGITPYEGDVSPLRRWFSDTGAGVQAPRIVYLDIETDSRKTFVEAKEGKARVLSWALVDQKTGERWSACLDGCHEDDEETLDNNEEALLRDLWHSLDGFDTIVSWNGDGFDFPIIKLRSHFLGVKRKDERRWTYLDQLLVHERMNTASESGEEKQSMKLDDIAQSLLGEGKTITPPGVIAKFGDKPMGALTYQMWAAGGEWRQMMVDYMIRDTDLLRLVEEKTGFIALFLALCEACRLFPDSVSLNPTHQVDGFLLRLGIERNIHFPTRRFNQEMEQKKFAGAYVMDPKFTGIAHNVHVCDFAGMYPSIILTWNMSPETKRLIAINGPIEVDHCRAPSTRVGFRTDVQGILPQALHELRRLRKHWSKLAASLPPGTPEWQDAMRKSTAYKVAVNSFYGVMGTPWSRYFDRHLAESITQNGVWLLRQVIAAAEERGWLAGYADTDSVFVTGCSREDFKSFVEWCNTDLFPRIVAETGCKENYIELAYEKEFQHLVMTSAKKYCNPPEAPILMADFTFKPLGEVQVGDMVMGWEKGDGPRRRHLVASRVGAVHRHEAPIVKVTTDRNEVIRCTPDHQWLRARKLTSNRGDKKYGYAWCEPKVGRGIVKMLDTPRALVTEEERTEAAWLGGIYDGEGSLSGQRSQQITIGQSPRVNPEVCARLEKALNLLGLDWSVKLSPLDGINRYAIRGGKQGRLNFLTWCRPAKGDRIAESMRHAFFSNFETRIVAVEPDGKGEVIGLTTETGNYVAWGYASKNCGSYAHYKGKEAVGTSKPEIKGLEYKRGDVTVLARRLQHEAILKLVQGIDDPLAYVEMVERARDHILTGDLPITEIQASKSISRPIKEYVVKKKTNGEDSAQPAHVRVAKILVERGEDVTPGTRINFYVTDATASPQALAPASDYKQDVDRHYVWEDQAWPPTKRLLEAGLPDYDWKAYDKTRPKKQRAKKGKPEVAEGPTIRTRPARKGRAAPEEQEALAWESTAQRPEVGNPGSLPTPPPAPRTRKPLVA
jgi:DNA polymerase elongation subunit (family B)